MTIDEVRAYIKKHFHLNRRLRESEVAAFEAKHHVTLPDEYRLFLTQLGNGAQAKDGWPRDVFPLGMAGEYQKALLNLDKPFPYTEPFHDVAYDLPTEYHIQGLLPFLHEGCGYHYALAITGPERGNVWMIDFASSESVVPITDEARSKERIGFFEWFR